MTTLHLPPTADRLPPTPADLAAQLTGSLVLPGHPDWDEARRAWNLHVDQHPAMVVWAETADDVVAVTRYAAANDLRIAAQSTGHGSCTIGDLTGTILLKTARMRGMAIDPAARRARVEAGVMWQDLAPLTAAHGLAGLAGSAGDIGVVGYSIGGGIGWLGRRYGLACNSILAADVVTADGELIRVDADHHAELFWALRGGGGSFGVITAIEIALHPVGEVHAGMLLWPIEHAPEVLQAWRKWTETVPDSVTSLGRILRFPPLEELPPFLRGRELVVIEACFLDGQPQADALLAELRALVPEVDTFATIPPPALAQLHMDPPQPVPGDGDCLLLSTLTAEGVDAVLATAGPGVASPLLSVEIRHLGGAFTVSDPDHGALDRMEGGFLYFGVGMPITPELGQAIQAHLSAVRDALAPWDAGRSYLNLAEQPTAPSKIFGRALPELLAVREVYDPAGRFHANHRVEAPGRD
jgi:hypothetical protein